MTSSRTILTGCKILQDENWVEDQALVLEGKIIKAIIPHEMMKHHYPATLHEYAAHHYIIPGFIDMHIHGANGYDVMDATPLALSKISEALAAEGVTSYLATTMTAPAAQIDKAILNVVAAMNANTTKLTGATILGMHLEGPFISTDKVGAQNRRSVVSPDQKQLAQWLDLGKDAIKLVTLAPELAGAKALIQFLHSQDVIAAVGHTNATYAQTMAGIKAGASYATHLFNAMSGLQHREPGAACALLLDRKVVAEIIVDGVHLHPAIVELAFRMKGKDNILLVTDSIRAKCLGDGVYDLGGQEVVVQAKKATLRDGTLAGSTLRMGEAVRNMQEFSHCSLPQAIAMATSNPARVLNMSQEKGCIDAGKDADIVVIDQKFNVKETFVQGQLIYKS